MSRFDGQPAGSVWVNRLTINDFQLQWGEDLPSFFTQALECVDVNDLVIDNFEGEANPAAPDPQRMKLERTFFKSFQKYQ